jgi:ribosomal protein S27E
MATQGIMLSFIQKKCQGCGETLVYDHYKEKEKCINLECKYVGDTDE